jgi:tetratricopeptide (TPR) repeat protein
MTEKVMDEPQASAWELFLAGAGSGLRSFYFMRKGSPLKSLGEANTAKKAFERAIAKDPSFADVYLGLGMFDYWRSVFTNRIKFLPFFSDKRASGLEKMEKANREGRVIGSLGDFALAFSFYQDRNAAKGKGIVPLENALKKYPENVIAKNLLVSFYDMRGSTVQAHALIDSLLKNNPEVTIAKYFKAYTYYRENKLAEARQWYQDYLATKPNKEWNSFTLFDLGMISLREKKETEAYDEFKEAYRADSNNSAALKQLQGLRRNEPRFGK